MKTFSQLCSLSFAIVMAVILSCSGSLYAGSVLILESEGITEVVEGQGLDYFTVTLSSEPTSDVTVTFEPASYDIELNGDYPGDPISLEFGYSSWSTPQTVSVRAVQDEVEEGLHSCQIAITVSSDDSGYDSIYVAPVQVSIIDYNGSPCPEADIDGDCLVTVNDLAILASQWLAEECTGDYCADIAGDSGIDIFDFEKLASQWEEGFGPVVINEFMARNGSNDPGVDQESWELFDENGDASDWIELYNISDSPISLDGWYLTDDSEDLSKWAFPSGISIDAGSFLIVFASGNDTVNGDFIHTNFSLSGDGEYLAIVNAQGKVVQSYDSYDEGFPAQEDNISYGLANYFSEERYFSPATPGSANVGPIIGLVADTSFSVKRGFYSEPFYVEITTDEPGTEIRYTTDGSTPSIGHGTVYDSSNPIYIDQTTTLRATAYKSGWLPSNVDTQTYIFVSDVITQSPNGETPAGWPDSYAANNHVMFYGMDPDIVNSPEYSGVIEEALKSIPSLSIVTDLDNLFNEQNGVYVHVDNDTRINGEYYEQPVSLELLDPNGLEPGFQVDCGLRLRGGYSRQVSNPKHSLRFYFRSKYGESKLEYPLFGDEGTDEFDKLDLRTSANYSWHNLWQGFNSVMGALNTCTRDEFTRLVQGMLGNPYTRGRYYHLYINGQYWGLYQTQERVDSRYAASYMGGSKEDYDVVKPDIVEGRRVIAADGELTAYHELHAAVADGIDADEYFMLQGMNPDGTINPEYKRLLDVDNLIDYMLLEYYPADYDGPASRFVGINNFYGVFNRTNPDGFKWFQHDGEHSFGAYEGQDSWRENMVTPLSSQGSSVSYFNPHWLHEQLANQNREYRMRFADRVQELFYNEGMFTPDKVHEVMDGLAQQIDKAIVGESARWGDTVVNNPRTRNNWLDALQFTYNWVYGTSSELTTDWTMNSRQTWPMVPRQLRVIEQFRSVNWFPSMEAPVFSQHGGYVDTAYSLTIDNPGLNGSVYYTTDGSDPRDVSIDATSVTSVLVPEDATKYVYFPDAEIYEPTHTVIADYYFDIGGGVDVSDLLFSSKYPDNPDLTEIWDGFIMSPYDRADNYGTRVRGLVYPPNTGNYRFWTASDDASSLRLSSDSSAANAVEIAYVSGWTNNMEWYREGNQRSDEIFLIAGQPYYIEVLQKEGTGGDNLSVGWSGPGVSGPVVISGEYLSGTQQVWTDIGYDHTSWLSGTGAVVYERTSGDYDSYLNNGGINVREFMLDKKPGCYVRIPFEYSGTDANGMYLKLRYDDGFVAYLNGVEIARDNVDDALVPLNYLTEAINYREDPIAVSQAVFDISNYIGLLQDGTNVLAIHGLNDSSSSSDFLLSPELVVSMSDIGSPSESALEYTSPLTLDKSVEVKARVYTGNEWSALEKATFGVGPVAESLRVTELMYSPADPNYEFVELVNIGSEPINLNKVRFTKGIDHDFGDVTLDAGGYLVLVRNKPLFDLAYPDLPASCIVEQWQDGALDNNGEEIRIKDALGNVVQEFEYDNWYSQTDEQGFSLSLLEPYDSDLSNWSNKQSWAASTTPGGTPGEFEMLIPAKAIVINELLAHSHDTLPDWVELYNTTDIDINIGGWYLSDSSGDLQKYQIPAGVIVPSLGYYVFNETDHFGGVFGLSENGEEIYLSSASGGVLTGYQESEDFGPSATGVSFGRYQKADGSYNFVSMAEPTIGFENSLPLVGPLVISELMYNPFDDGDAEYIEIVNIDPLPVDLWSYDGNTDEYIPWRILDEGGVMLEFPIGTSLSSGEKMLLIYDLDSFVDEFGPIPSGVQYLEWTDGKLGNSGEKIELQMPGDTDGIERFFIRVDRVNYDDSDPWPASADGDGDSLNRIYNDRYGNDYINWQGGDPTPGL